nr:MAG: capsid protein [Picornaviridae sp.]
MNVFEQMGNNAEILAPTLERDNNMERAYFRDADEQPGMVENTALLGSVLWSPSDPEGTLLMIPNVWNALMGSTNLEGRAKSFTYATGKIKIIINTQGFAPAYGRIIVMATPSVATHSYVCNANARILPHVIVDPSKTATYELELPLYNNQGVFRVKDPRSWDLHVYVYDVLASGTDVANPIRLTIRGALDGVHFVGKTIPLSNFVELTNPVGVAMKAAAEVTTSVIKAYIPPLATMSQVLADGSVALRSLGFSKPQSIGIENPRLNNTADNYTQVDGVSTAVVLGRSQIMESTVDPGIMLGKPEDMELSYLLSKPVRVTRFSLSPVVSPGHLFAVPVSPHNSAFNMLNSQEQSLAQQMLAIHSFWSGTMQFTLEVPASVFQRCVLLVAYDPSPNPGAAPSMADAITYLDNYTVVVSGNTSVKFSIPWRQPNIALPPNGNNGVLRIYLMESIVSNGSTSSINLDIIGDWSLINYHFPEDRIDAKPLGDWVETTNVSFGTQDVNHTVMVGGDTTRSIKDLACRMSLTHSAVESGETELMVSIPNHFTNQTVFGQDWGKYLSQFFLGVRGSRRLSVMVPNMQSTDIGIALKKGNLSGIVWQALSTYPELVPYDTLGATICNVDVCSTGDVILPYVSDVMYEYGCTYSTSRTMAVVRFHGNTFAILEGAGDDTIYGFFLGVPLLPPPP